VVTPSVASQTTSATSARSAARRDRSGVVLERLPHLGLAPDPGGVDEHELAAVEGERQVDRVARRARLGRDDDPLRAGEAVEQRGLADVGPPDEREAHRVVAGVLVGRLRREGGHPIQEVAGAEPLGGGDGDRLAQSQGIEVGDQRHVLDRVDLVGGHEHRQRRAAQELGHLLVAGAQPGLGVDHEHRRVGVGQGSPGLILDLASQGVAVVQVHAAGVDQGQRAAVPLRAQLLAITCDPRLLVHDRLARLGQAIDQRGLADIGIPDDRNLHGASRLADAARVTRWGRRSVPAPWGASRQSVSDCRADGSTEVVAGAGAVSGARGRLV
jgi:hypothetical protein